MQVHNPQTITSELDVSSVEQVDAVLRSMTKSRRECELNYRQINFWLDVRLDVLENQQLKASKEVDHIT